MVRITTTLRKWGNSVAVRIPKEVLYEASFKVNDKVDIFADGTGITIQKVKKFKSLDDLFAGYAGSNTYEEFNTGKPVGNEVW